MNIQSPTGDPCASHNLRLAGGEGEGSLGQVPKFSIVDEARGYLASEFGASAAEYALLLAVLAGCALVILHRLGGALNRSLGTVTNDIALPH